jgi:hypothetical protein
MTDADDVRALCQQTVREVLQGTIGRIQREVRIAQEISHVTVIAPDYCTEGGEDPPFFWPRCVLGLTSHW